MPEAPPDPGETHPVLVQCIGSGDAFGSGGRLQSAYSIVHRGHRHMLDFGATSLSGLARHGIAPEEIETVVISHYHGDHYGGLPFLLRYRQLNRITSALTIAGPRGLEERLERALDALFPPGRQGEVRRLAQLHEIVENQPLRIGFLRIRGFPADHRPETQPMTLRVDVGGLTIGYTGDSAWCSGVEAAGNGADLLIVEAYANEPVRHHMSIVELAEGLPRLGCRRIVVTHLSRAVLDAPPDLPHCIVAHDGLELILEPAAPRRSRKGFT